MRSILVFLSLIFGLSFTAKAGEDAVYTGWLNNNAVSGYDTVAYFSEGKAREGSKEYTTTYKGANWRFVNAENLALFVANPEKYAPQYGGYCAWGLANGHAVSSDPEAWKIVDGKLYLNYNQKVQKRWIDDTEWAIIEADKQFPELVDVHQEETTKQ